MKSCKKLSILVAALAVVILGAADAEAQRIRTFGESEGGAASGAAVSTQTPTAESGTAASGEDGPVGSYQVRIQGQQNGRSAANSQRLATLDPMELYRGVIPGKRDEVSHIDASDDRSRPNPLTWVGFQAETERTRVFFQAPRALEYRIGEDPQSGDLIVTFSNARIPERNFSRFIDASFFNRSVERIEAREVRRGTVEVRIARRDGVSPAVSIDGQYLYLDFPHRSE